MWGNGHFATREGHYHPIGGDLNDRLRNAVLQTGYDAGKPRSDSAVSLSSCIPKSEYLFLDFSTSE